MTEFCALCMRWISKTIRHPDIADAKKKLQKPPGILGIFDFREYLLRKKWAVSANPISSREAVSKRTLKAAALSSRARELLLSAMRERIDFGMTDESRAKLLLNNDESVDTRFSTPSSTITSMRTSSLPTRIYVSGFASESNIKYLIYTRLVSSQEVLPYKNYHWEIA